MPAVWTWLSARLRTLLRAGQVVGLVPPIVPAGTGARAVALADDVEDGDDIVEGV